MTYYNQVIEKLTGIRDNTLGVSSSANPSIILDDIAIVDGIVDLILVNSSDLYQSNTTITANISNTDALVNAIKTITDNLPDSGALTSMNYNQSVLLEEVQHSTLLFPDETDDYIRLYAGFPNNSFSAWTQLKSYNNATFSDLINNTAGHITGMMVENTEMASTRYIIEVAYGANKTVVAQQRFYSDTVKLPTVQQTRMSTLIIPAGEEVYTRSKASNGSKYSEISLRYHTH